MLVFKKELLFFLIVGSVTFFLDAILFRIFYFLFENSILSRILSYSVSTLIAWKSNSIFTFKKNSSFFSYLFGASLSGAQNILVSLLLINKFSPFVSIGAGCLWGLIFNYFFQKKLTFK